MTEIIARHHMTDLEIKYTGQPQHGITASGYGRKIPTRTMVRLPDSPRWRRVYMCAFSNAATFYVTAGKDWIVLF